MSLSIALDQIQRPSFLVEVVAPKPLTEIQIRRQEEAVAVVERGGVVDGDAVARKLGITPDYARKILAILVKDGRIEQFRVTGFGQNANRYRMVLLRTEA